MLQIDVEGKKFFQENKYLGKKSIYSGTSIYYLFIAKGMGKFIWRVRYIEHLQFSGKLRKFSLYRGQVNN